MAVRTLAHTAFAATPEGVAQELAQSLSCGCGEPLCREDIRRLAKALFAAAGHQPGTSTRGLPAKALDHIGEALDILTGKRLPEQSRALAVITARRPK